MNVLSGFMVLNANGADRISYTYNEIDDETGEQKSANNKKNFYIVDQELLEHVEAIRTYIRENKLSE